MTQFLTHSGIMTDFANFTEDMICVEDIAHHLTKVCRYGGSLPLDMHYSVAQHSMYVALQTYLQTENLEAVKFALFHDAAEAYLGDCVSGLKKCLPDYKDLESKVEGLIFKKFGINTYWEPLVKKIDKSLMLDEVAALRPNEVQDYKNRWGDIEPLGIEVRLYNQQWTKAKFLQWCKFVGVN